MTIYKIVSYAGFALSKQQLAVLKLLHFSKRREINIYAKTLL